MFEKKVEEPGPEDAVPDEPMIALVEQLDLRQKNALKEFRKMGFSLSDGLKLVYADAPWFRVQLALDRGCTLAQALHIWT